MKKSFCLTLLSAAAIFIFSQAIYRDGFSNRVGAPSGRTGSPFDNSGVACNAFGCHTGFPVTNVTGWITSTIPGAGYVPGSTYTISAGAMFTSCVRFGFEISPQTGTGALAGTNIITDATNTRFASSNPKYVTHTTTGSNAMATPGTKAWSFNWTAPATGTGTVTFYGAFNCANNNNSNSGDQIFLSTLVVTEDITSSMSQPADESFAFDAFPNPASANIFVSITVKQSLTYSVQLVDVSGKCMKDFSVQEIFPGHEKRYELDVADISPGVYFLQVKSDERIATKKIIVF
ncbi:MAG TPA: choice-of-anchor V domain-containing protein [Bacteroidia bacterium]|nr:choice-of-anchor V domain-containing protein [Bacteroidia bacterium]